jgi:hypothetical protein
MGADDQRGGGTDLEHEELGEAQQMGLDYFQLDGAAASTTYRSVWY